MSDKKKQNFIQAISIVCIQEGCTLEGVNGLTLDIHCPDGPEQELKCAEAVQRFIQNARPDVEVDDGPEDGCGDNCDCRGKCGH